MKLPAIGALLLLCTQLASSSAQETPVLQVQLHPSRQVTSAALASDGVVATEFEDRSFLVQFSTSLPELPPEARVTGSLIHRISFDARDDTQFDVMAVVRPEALAPYRPTIAAFTSNRYGEVFVLTAWEKIAVAFDGTAHVIDRIVNIVHFDAHGSFIEIIPLDPGAKSAGHMACFEDGNFALITDVSGASALLIVSGRGDLLTSTPLGRQPAVTSPAQPPGAADPGNPDDPSTAATQSNSQPSDNPAAATPAPASPPRLQFIWTGPRLAPAPDGSIYMALPDQPAKIFKVASDGTIDNLDLDPSFTAGVPAGKLALDHLAVNQSQLVVFYAQQADADAQNIHNLINTYDLFTGRLTATYVGDLSATGTDCAGWDPTGPYYLRYNKDISPPGFEIIASTQ